MMYDLNVYLSDDIPASAILSKHVDGSKQEMSRALFDSKNFGSLKTALCRERDCANSIPHDDGDMAAVMIDESCIILRLTSHGKFLCFGCGHLVL